MGKASKASRELISELKKEEQKENRYSLVAVVLAIISISLIGWFCDHVMGYVLLGQNNARTTIPFWFWFSLLVVMGSAAYLFFLFFVSSANQWADKNGTLFQKFCYLTELYRRELGKRLSQWNQN